MEGSERLVSYIFLTGFLSGSIFMYSGLMMFMSGLATGVVCSRAGWIDRVYKGLDGLTGRDWIDFNVHIANIFTQKT